MPLSRALAVLCGVLLCASGLFAVSGDFCDSSLCQNGGTCLISQDNDVYCLCPEGFTGLVCSETEKGPCSPNPCYNDGKCQVTENTQRGDIFTQYICQCSLGYSGTHCEISTSSPKATYPGQAIAEVLKKKLSGASFPPVNETIYYNLEGDYLSTTAVPIPVPNPGLSNSLASSCTSTLGMEGGAIANSQISASSVYVGFLGVQRWGPELARLHSSGLVNAWTASDYDSKPWIQVNLLRKMRVSGVITQGASRAGRAEYLKTFKVAYSLDGLKFKFIQNASGSGDKVFWGNMDNNGLKVNMFSPSLEAQYIRLYPVSCYRACTLRFELLGCELNGCSEPLGLKNNSIPDSHMTASSTYKTWNLRAFGWYPHYGRLDMQGKINAWTAQSNSNKEWLQVDLCTQRHVTGIITQGARDFGQVQYVASYKVAHSNDGVEWTIYKEQGTDKVFLGNSDNNSHKKNIFETPIVARYVRVLPVSWHKRITLRLELLGC
ncbi:lactadherin isoform X1 [Cricetulus griseus]|uniref:Lactadherin isoform X5 n=3 Tax=Cricetulus griseus TaxID=10029 RepID=A0A9J7JJT4_CRIGR|nr:lactadherin isoform X1 [Cricetulus griseus]XP_027263985.1 lactadherin isoform X5 [Cricetulus griseus]